ncbi:MAG: type II toxin-antitoxin system RelE/ParE family toxin [Clostridia bacterium]|nr:type II toxin-antitoxin system RelE/ParE family toxin [Clostridia bacterium]
MSILDASPISDPVHLTDSFIFLLPAALSLDALISVHTEYRYLPCENYCIFYLEDEKNVVIVRVLHQRQEYLRALFNL